MTNIVGTIQDSGGTALGGTLQVKLPSPMTTDTTVPDTVYLPKTKSFTITSGSVNINLPESETSQLAYNFKFFETGETVTPLWDFNAIVPNTASYELASLIPTGITNDNLDTGALRVAKLLVSDPQLSVLVKPVGYVSVEFAGQATQATKYFPKSFAAASIELVSLSIFGLSGYENWSFQLGVVNSSGNDETALTPASTSTLTQNGRRRIVQTYSVSRAASVLGFYVRVTPDIGATPLNATLVAAFRELS